MNKEFELLKAEFEAKKKEIFARITPEFIKKSKELFDKWPKLNSFGVDSYTPYFNDGDPCTWGLYNDPERVKVNGLTYHDLGDYRVEDAEKEGIDWMSVIEKNDWDDIKFQKEYLAGNEVFDDVYGFFNMFPREYFKEVYGEGTITVNRNGTVTVEECEHC